MDLIRIFEAYLSQNGSEIREKYQCAICARLKTKIKGVFYFKIYPSQRGLLKWKSTIRQDVFDGVTHDTTSPTGVSKTITNLTWCTSKINDEYDGFRIGILQLGLWCNITIEFRHLFNMMDKWKYFGGIVGNDLLQLEKMFL